MTTAVIIGIGTLLAVLSVFLRAEARIRELETKTYKRTRLEEKIDASYNVIKLSGNDDTLDAYGELYGVQRMANENDSHYRKRIIKRIAGE